jgi:hypothetical protein
MFRVSDTAISHIEELYPRLYRVLHPRRIVPPAGYAGSRQCVIGLYTGIHAWLDPELRGVSHIALFLNTLAHVKYGVPIYYVASELSQALVHTEPPQDFRLREIHPPLPAMTFMLHEGFARHYFGYRVPYLSTVWIKDGLYPDAFHDLPPVEIPWNIYEKLRVVGDKFIVSAPVFSENDEIPVFYFSTYLLDMQISEIGNLYFEESTYFEEKLFEKRYGVPVNKAFHSQLPKVADDADLVKKISAFAVKLMTFLGAVPLDQILVKESLARPQKIKKGNRIQEELWSPNLLGWSYRAHREKPKSEVPHGTHASPRMHWRRGHFRNQPYGPKPWTEMTPKKLIWIEPVLVNKPD